MNTERAIDLLKRLLEACPGAPQWHCPGKLTVRAGSAGVDRALLNELEGEEIFHTIVEETSRQTPTLPAGSAITLETACLVDRLVIVESIDALIHVDKARKQEPQAYVVWHADKAVFHVKGEPITELPEPLPSYHQAVDLWNLLKSFCHHPDRTTDSLWFFGVRRTEIASGFTIDDLKTPLDIKAVVDFMAPTDAHETRKEILSSRIAQHLRDIDPEKRFPFLLTSLPVFARGLSEAMAIYLCEHSPEKLADEAAKSALDYTEKLEKIVSGLETKSLAIPAAIWLAYKDVNKEAGLGNWMIVLASVLFFVTMLWVWWTQSSLLDLLHKSMVQQEAEFQKKGLDSRNPILIETFAKLKDRAFNSEKYAGWMMWASLIPIAASFVKWKLL